MKADLDAQYVSWLDARDALLEARYHSLPTPRIPFSDFYKKNFAFSRTATEEDLIKAGWIKRPRATDAKIAARYPRPANSGARPLDQEGEKKCAFHKIYEPLENFAKNSSHSDGLQS